MPGRRQFLHAAGAAAVACVAGCAESRGTATPSSRTTTPTVTGSVPTVRVRAEYAALSSDRTARPVWFHPPAHAATVREAAGTVVERTTTPDEPTASYEQRVTDDVPLYEVTALRENDTALFPHDALGPTTLFGERLAVAAAASPALRRRVWYTPVTPTTDVRGLAALPAPQRHVARRAVAAGARDRTNRVELDGPVVVFEALDGRRVTLDDETVRFETGVVETPRYPPQRLSVGYGFARTDATPAFDFIFSPPVADTRLTALLDGDDPLRVRRSSDFARAVREQNPLVLTYTSAWRLTVE